MTNSILNKGITDIILMKKVKSDAAQVSPTIRGSRSAPSALAAAHETLGNR